LVVAAVVQANFVCVEETELSTTARGTNGFGHTGIHEITLC